MNKLITTAIVIVTIYFLIPVPCCRLSQEYINESESVYTLDEVLTTKADEVNLLNVKGESMTPTIKDNSKCLCITKEDYSVGDIIFFFAKRDKWVGIAHRIISINGEEIITHGDNNDFLDFPMKKENIICSIPYVPRYRILFGL